MRIYELGIDGERVLCTRYTDSRWGKVGKTSISQGFELSRRVIIGPKER